MLEIIYCIKTIVMTDDMCYNVSGFQKCRKGFYFEYLISPYIL